MKKSLECGAKKRHHNPVDSICKKIKSIQMMDQVSNPALQIPKFQSRNFDSPQSNTKKNLEEILKGRTCRSQESACSPLISPGSDRICFLDSPHPGASSADTTFPVLCSGRSSSSWMPTETSPYCFGPREANLSFTGGRQALGYKADSMYDVSLICEEDLLTTIFCACDIHCTGLLWSLTLVSALGKVAVSKIVDYLRHTTSRGSEDSGLEELCNMLDPEHKDVSMDLETYRAVMGEWIEDCKRKCLLWEQGILNFPCGSGKKMHARMNVTSGSLEAFGGDVSKGDMETSDLITCVADLQYNNQKLQEENNKLKVTLEAVDETNSKLLADNEHLRQQLKSVQQSVLKAKSLEEELEEARNNVNVSEEKREQVLWQNKQLVGALPSLNMLGNSLYFKFTAIFVIIRLLLKLNHTSYCCDGGSNIILLLLGFFPPQSLQKEQDIKELKLTIVECSSIIETLRAEKNKLLENIQHMQQELISNGLSFPLLYKFNSNIPEGMSSLHCELELAQSSEALKQELGEKTHLWIQKLQLLEKCKDSLDKDFIRVAGNLRRTKTEQLHLRKELSARYPFKACISFFRKGVWFWGWFFFSLVAEDQVEAFHSLREEAASLKSNLEEAISEQQKLRDVNAALASTCQLLQEKVEDHKKNSLGRDFKEKLIPSPCHGQGHLLLSQVAQSPIQPGLEHCQGSRGRHSLSGHPVPVSTQPSLLQAEPPHLFQQIVLVAFSCNPELFKLPCNSQALQGLKAGTDSYALQNCRLLHLGFHTQAFLPAVSCYHTEALLTQTINVQVPKCHVSVQIYLNYCITWIPLKSFLSQQAEFLRLSLGFKCDLFTLDKRVKLEERSRDLAEENLKKEITNAVKMLEALVPLCEEDNQAQEIIKKLQKSLQFLSQYAARVASRAEMLGAINQESRVSKAVEVMIQHVENLKRMYAKEHAELEELKQVLLQNERSFSSLGDRGNQEKPLSPSLRRVSIATVPRSAGNAGSAVPLVSRGWVKQNEKRPSLQRFLSTYSWAEYEEEHFETKALCSPVLPRYSLMSAWASHFKASFCNANKTLWVSVSILVLLAALTSFLTGLSLQRPADAAPVGTGDSWTSLQQLLWPYTGLQHHGPPPV
uniref:Inositol 1,4,5-triphosphate receptor associated 2 n=1 Tax=Catharus ustulatus TaxID=91951 RepID=A0A8C3TPT0_CATUS